MDGGAYCTLTPVVLSRGTLHAGGPYRCPERAHPRPRDGRTNTPPNGAFRGFGAPQTEFAAEMQVNRIAEAARAQSPLEIRRRSVYRLGDDDAHRPGPAGRAWPARRSSSAPPRRPSSSGSASGRAGREHSASGAGTVPEGATRTRANAGRAGSGSPLAWHGAGFTGSGEVKLASVASVELTARGRDPDPDRLDGDGPGDEDDLPAARRRRSWASPTRRSRWRRRTPRSCPTAGPPSRRERRWSSVGS